MPVVWMTKRKTQMMMNELTFIKNQISKFWNPLGTASSILCFTFLFLILSIKRKIQT